MTASGGRRTGYRARSARRGAGTPFRTATYPTQCAAIGCGLAIRRGDPLVPHPRGGYQHPSCASGGDDQ